MVAAFQPEDDSPLFLLSLKANGTGLNRTEAKHVFHLDRRRHPAVENQATDRAFRIGQWRNVQVGKFITTGTPEERPEEVMEQKQALAVLAWGELPSVSALVSWRVRPGRGGRLPGVLRPSGLSCAETRPLAGW